MTVECSNVRYEFEDRQKWIVLSPQTSTKKNHLDNRTKISINRMLGELQVSFACGPHTDSLLHLPTDGPHYQAGWGSPARQQVGDQILFKCRNLLEPQLRHARKYSLKHKGFNWSAFQFRYHSIDMLGVRTNSALASKPDEREMNNVQSCSTWAPLSESTAGTTQCYCLLFIKKAPLLAGEIKSLAQGFFLWGVVGDLLFTEAWDKTITCLQWLQYRGPVAVMYVPVKHNAIMWGLRTTRKHWHRISSVGRKKKAWEGFCVWKSQPVWSKSWKKQQKTPNDAAAASSQRKSAIIGSSNRKSAAILEFILTAFYGFLKTLWKTQRPCCHFKL